MTRPCVGSVVMDTNDNYYIVYEARLCSGTVCVYDLCLALDEPPVIGSVKRVLMQDENPWWVVDSAAVLGWSAEEREAAFWSYYQTAHAADLRVTQQGPSSIEADLCTLLVLPCKGALIMSPGPVTIMETQEQIALPYPRQYVVVGSMFLADGQSVVVFARRAEQDETGSWSVGVKTVVLTHWTLLETPPLEDPDAHLQLSRELFKQWHQRLTEKWHERLDRMDGDLPYFYVNNH